MRRGQRVERCARRTGRHDEDRTKRIEWCVIGQRVEWCAIGQRVERCAIERCAIDRTQDRAVRVRTQQGRNRG